MSVLVISINSLFGTIPTTIGYLSKLAVFAAGTNSFTGSIPSQLGNLISLANLALGQNKLTGTIPTSLGQMTALSVLTFDNTKIYGSVPASLCQAHLTTLTGSATSIACYANCLSTVTTRVFDASVYACTQGKYILIIAIFFILSYTRETFKMTFFNLM